MINTRLRPAIAMIELIFALVIMGITLMSAPLLVSQATNSSIVGLQQESIAMIASHSNAIMTYAWDEQNTPLKSNAILTVSATADPLLSPANRVVPPPGKRKFDLTDPNATASVTLGTDVIVGNEPIDDADDFDGTTQSLILTVNAVTNEGDYIDQNINIATTVRYMQDTAAYNTSSFTFDIPQTPVFSSKPTNIKHITTVLTSNSASADLSQKQITLKSFMCNIGAALPDSSGNMNTGELQNAPLGLF